MPNNNENVNLPGYWGVVAEETSEEDYQLLAGTVDLPNPRKTYWDHQNQYQQTEVSPVSCTVHGALGAVSDLTGNVFSLEQRKFLWDEAVKLGADPSVGWYVSRAVDLVRKFASVNFSKEELVSFRVDLDSQEFTDNLEKGYSFVVAYRGNANFQADKNDGTLDLVKLDGKSTFGHCLRIVKHKDKNMVRMIIDNYPQSGHNAYDIPLENLPKLVQNGIFYQSAYVLAYKSDVNNPPSLVSSFAVKSWQKALLKGVVTDKSDPKSIAGTAWDEKLLFAAKFLTSILGTLSLERKIVAMDRASLLD